MSGVDEIAAERKRQIEREGWSAEHDDHHSDQSLALAAALYASPVSLYQIKGVDGVSYTFSDPWPWHGSGVNGAWNCWDKRTKHHYRRRLVIAGALLAAEIDRLDRAARARPVPGAPRPRQSSSSQRKTVKQKQQAIA